MDSKITWKLVNAISTSFALSIPSRDLKEVVFAAPLVAALPVWLSTSLALDKARKAASVH